MKLTFILSILFAALQIISPCSAQQVYYGNEASQKYPYATVLRLKGENRVPDYIQFSAELSINEGQIVDFLSKLFNLSADYSFELMKAESDNQEQKHLTFQQYYKGSPVEFGIYKAHFIAGKLSSINGAFYTNIDQSASPSIEASVAVQSAINAVNASTYKWDVPMEEALLKYETQNAEASYFPKPALVWVATNGDYNRAVFQLAYKMDIYASQPLSRQNIYVDAHTGLVVYSTDQIHTADSLGNAVTVYSGNRAMMADYFNNQFRLRETGRGNGIQTYDLNNTSNYGAAVDFIDFDNNWNNVNASMDQYATDAHWGAEMTYDYFDQVHNRNSIDGNGFMLKSYVHYNTGYNNAFWDGQRMTYGDGNGVVFNPLTDLDITGHEITHGLTSNSAGLVYANESGALNESFSDIFGISVSAFANNNTIEWSMGEHATPNGLGIRSMSNPNTFQDPDTYLGTNYYTGTQDNGGVHTNSGVQNHWYYRLTVGGTGTNDIGNAFNVTGLGITNASKIAFRNLTVYLTPNVDHQDARFYAIQSTIDLFGPCTPEVIATTNAWHAVGVGAVFSYTVTAGFSTTFQTYCQSPALVTFANASTNSGSFLWNFGDGGTSTALNPSHTYMNPGSYTVSLTASGGACGSDTETLLNYIVVDPNLPCAITMNPNGVNQTQTTCSGSLFDPGGLANNYQDNITSTITIAPAGASTITLNFSSFNLELDYDYLYIYNGNSVNSPLIGQYTGTTLPNGGSITSLYGAVTLKFFSDTYVNNPGFVMTWSCNLPSTPPLVDFYATTQSTCDGVINFVDVSTNGPIAWQWDFGDGTSSNLQSPTHVYTQNGIFSVQLIASNAQGQDTIIKPAYINVSRPVSPIASDLAICQADSVTITASAFGNVVGYSDEFSATPLWFGNTYSTYLAVTDTFWLENNEPQPLSYVGPLTNAIGTSANHNNASVQYLTFNVQQPLTIISAWVSATGAGDRTITLWDASGNQLDTRFVNIPAGASRVALNFHVPPGNAYRMGGSQMNLVRNNGGVVYPYSIPGMLQITGSSAGATYYYYFYDWEIQKDACLSPRVPVVVLMDSVDAVFTGNTVGMTYSTISNTSFNATNYAWDFGNATFSNLATPSNLYTSPGTYNVMLVASNANCSDTAYFTSFADDAGLDDLTGGLFQLNVSPNPFNESCVLDFEIDSPQNMLIEIVDMSGRLVYTKSTGNLAIGKHSIQLPLIQLVTGQYMLVVKESSTLKKQVLKIQKL